MKLWSYLLVVAGLLLILFPVWREWHYDHQQQQLLEESMRQMADSDKQALQVENDQLSQLLAQEPTIESAASELQNEQAIGIIRIAAIDVELPILEGATQKNMKVSAVHMTETAALGEIGNAAIAAHRARTAGRLFNRLDELKEDDRITILLKDKEIEYTVDHISVVKPTDISVLEPVSSGRELTLITCTPLVNPTHRLIIHATAS